MPRLPTREDLGYVQPSAAGTSLLSPVQERTVQLPNAPDPMAMALTGAGEGLESFAVAIKKETDRLDSIVAEDALNKIRQERLNLTMGDGGAYTVKGGGVLTPTYMSGYKDRFDTTANSIMSKLTPAQQAKLKPHIDQEGLGFQADLLRHSMREAEQHKVLVRKGHTQTLQSAAVSNWGDEGAFGEYIAKLFEVSDQQALEQGIDTRTDEGIATVKALARETLSPAYVGAIVGALDSKTSDGLKRAETMFAEGAAYIDPSQRLKLGETIRTTREGFDVQAGAKDEVAKIVEESTAAGALNMALYSASTSFVESGGRHVVKGKDGQARVIEGPVIDNPKSAHYGERAVGRYQIMPKTGKQLAKAAGVEWDKDLFMSPTAEGEAYHKILHEAHLKEIASTANTTEEAAIMYIAGPEGLKQAKAGLAKYQKLKGMGVAAVLPGSYGAMEEDPARPVTLAHFAPKASEVVPYVQKVTQRYKELDGFRKPDDAKLMAAAAARYPNRPDLARAEFKAVSEQLKIIEDGIKAGEENAKVEAYKVLDRGGSYADIPASVLAKLTFTQKDELKHAAEKVLDPNRATNPSAYDRFIREPNTLAAMPESEWLRAKPLFSEADYKTLSAQRRAVIDGRGNHIDVVKDEEVRALVSERLKFVGVDPTPKEDDTEAVARLVTLNRTLRDAILREQKTTGRQLTGTDLESFINTQFKNEAAVNSWFGSDIRPVLMMTYSDIPSGERSALKKQLVDMGVRNPTDAEILQYYKAGKLNPQAPSVKAAPKKEPSAPFISVMPWVNAAAQLITGKTD